MDMSRLFARIPSKVELAATATAVWFSERLNSKMPKVLITPVACLSANCRINIRFWKKTRDIFCDLPYLLCRFPLDMGKLLA